MGKKNKRTRHPDGWRLWHKAPGADQWTQRGTFATRADAWAACQREPGYGVWKVLPAERDANALPATAGV